MSPVEVEILEAQRRRHVGEHDQLECEGGVVRDVGDGDGLGSYGDSNEYHHILK